MRIKSRFRDYYDGLQGSDQELEPLYLRHTVQVARPVIGLTGGNEHNSPSDHLQIENFTVGFCGAAHRGYLLRALDSKYVEVGRTITYELAGVDAFVEKHFGQEVLDYWHGREINWSRTRRLGFMLRRAALVRRQDVNEQRVRDEQARLAEFFIQQRTPILLAVGERSVLHPAPGQYKALAAVPPPRDTVHLFTNPNLSRVEFFRVMPPPQAYQAIRQWLCNLSSPEKPIPAIDDVTMAEAKGFDKFSFRKAKRER